jgi:hypothetical protein
MGQETTIHNMVAAYIPEVPSVVIHLKDVVVAFYKNLVTIKLRKYAMHFFSTHCYVAKKVHLIVWLYNRVVTLDKLHVHLLCVVKRTQLSSIMAKELADTLMTKVRVRVKKYSRHSNLHKKMPARKPAFW